MYSVHIVNILQKISGPAISDTIFAHKIAISPQLHVISINNK